MTKKSLLEHLKSFEEDMKWLNQHNDRLKHQYADQYVAVLAQKVIDHDASLQSLVSRIEENYPGDIKKIAIKYVSPKKVELIL